MRATPLIAIRDRSPEDEAFIRDLSRTAFGEYSLAAERHARAMASRGETLVAHEADRPLGFAIIEPNGEDSAHLSAIAVVEEARGTGIGRRLLRAAERLAKARGARRMVLVTADSNLPALELFLRDGFTRIGNTGRYARGQRTLLLAKRL